MVGEFFILLMFFGTPSELKEFTIRDGLSECLRTKRTIERNIRGGKSVEYKGTMRLACKELEVEYDDKFNIIRFVDGKPGA
tara:strand:- start:879 stop:1121 length:243 start_codon:yes stop_codon:yes gene_type:complete